MKKAIILLGLILLFISCNSEKFDILDGKLNNMSRRLDILEEKLNKKEEILIMKSKTPCYVWDNNSLYKNASIRLYAYSLKYNNKIKHYFYVNYSMNQENTTPWDNYKKITDYKLIKNK